jgi:chromosome partitioning protein
VSVEDRTGRLRERLAGHRGHDVCFIDCPPSLGLLTLNALTAADTLLVPLQCEFFALEGLSQLLTTVEQVQQRFNPDLGIIGVVLTMFDRRNRLTDQVSEDVRECLGGLVFDAVIPRNVRLSEAPSHGKPILLYDVHSKGATAYLELAAELLRRLPPPQLPVTPPSPAYPATSSALQGARSEPQASEDHRIKFEGRNPPTGEL